MAKPEGGVLSRTSLLALYASPLVPHKLEGMKDLSEWYGEYTTPPSPPIQRSQLSSSRTNSSSAVPQSNSNSTGTGGSRRLTPFNSDSNPFANFGRFGVDGGLIGEPLEMPRRRGGGDRGTKGGTLDGEGREKDLAPHLLARRGERDGDKLPPWASESPASKRETFLKEERNNRSSRSGGGLANGELEPRRSRTGDTPAKDRRGLGPADEGGWRSVGTTREEREKRLLRNQSSNNSNTNPTDSPRRFERTHERGDRETQSRGGRGGPAWMNDEESSSMPWMDSNASGKSLKDGLPAGAAPEAGGGGIAGGGREDDDILDVATPTKKNMDWQATSGPGGMDSIQQWKAQMKEMERKERERDLRDAGIEPQPREEGPESVFSALTSPKPEAASIATKSIFEDLGIVRSPAVTSAAPPGLNVAEVRASSQGGGGGESGGRASRFAKFFDGKPQSPVTQAQQPPPSVFGALMGGATASASTSAPSSGSAGPSKEDAESMARLLGMLQVQGSRVGSPSTDQLPTAQATPSGLASPATVSSPAPSSAQPPAEETRSSSRFKFSSSTARTSSPSVGTRSVPASQPPSVVHSPTAPSQTIPAAPPPPGFGGYPQAQTAALNHLPPALSPADRMRSPPLPLPQSQQTHQNMHHPRTISSTSDLGPRPTHSSPLPPPHATSQQQHQQHQQQNPGNVGLVSPPSYPPQFYTQNQNQTQNNAQRIAQGPLAPSHPHTLPPSMGVYPNGHVAPPPPPPGMMNAEMLRNLAATGNGMRSPPLPGHSGPGVQGAGPGMSFPPPHGLAGMPPPQALQGRGGMPQGMMYPPPPPPPLGHPAQYHGGVNVGRPGPVPGPAASMGGNPGADLFALLNSGANGGMRIGGQVPPHAHQQQGNLPHYLMEGR